MSCSHSASTASKNILSIKRFIRRPVTIKKICRRWSQIKATPSAGNGNISTAEIADARIPESTTVDSPDARFEVLGSPYSVLSVNLSASQNLYTRRGTLIGVGGKAENVTSTLSMQEPVRRSLLGIPFLYQKIRSTSPVTALISTKSPITSFAVAHLNGTVDWMVAQRNALLAWTGDSLSVRPTVNRRMVGTANNSGNPMLIMQSIAHWGNIKIAGRGLIAVAGKGQVYQLALNKGESYVAHPSNVVAYTMSPNPPIPYRLKSNVFRLEVPSFGLSQLIPETRFLKAIQDSDTWKNAKKLLYTLRTWSRRTIWGDRLFLHFHGPVTVLLQSRASRVSDVLTIRDVNEMADSEPGAVDHAISILGKTLEPAEAEAEKEPKRSDAPAGLKVASIGKDGKVSFEETANFKGL